MELNNMKPPYNVTEIEWKGHEAYYIQEDLIEMLGIDMTKWHWSQGSEFYDTYEIIYHNNQDEDWSFSVTISGKSGEWDLIESEICRD
jgi:hypothetical protein